ncbi:hypothetical protein BZT13_22715 [Salmonella enterica subsp. enterica]|nr:hypothetical protein [Salmonella enterica subsp. enterica serovar Newport]MIV87171.1 hypothetical protein [Salmonella enterica subsp. enterica serovar Newport]
MSTFEKLAIVICFMAIAAALITSTHVAKNVPKPKTGKSEAKYWQGFMDKNIEIFHANKRPLINAAC